MLGTVLRSMLRGLLSQWDAMILIAAVFFGLFFGTFFSLDGGSFSWSIDGTILGLVFFLFFEVNFKAVFSSLNRFQFIALVMAVNFVIIPLLAFAVVNVILPGYPALYIGLLIYFMMPCTDWFLGFTRLAKGNTVLGTALIPLNMVIQIILYPVYLHLFGIEMTNASSAHVVGTLIQWFFLPLVMAILAKGIMTWVLKPHQKTWVQASVSRLIPIGLAGLVFQIFAANSNYIILNKMILPLILTAIMVFFVIIFFLSEVLARFFRLSYEDHVLLAMTTTARNAPLMLALTIAVLPNQPIVYTMIVIGMLVEFPHLIALQLLFNKRYRRRQLNQTVAPAA